MIGFNRKNLISGVIFLISPVVGVLFALHNLKKNQLNFFYILLSLFFALIFLKNPPLYDLYRYMEMYDYLNTATVFSGLSNYTVFYYISLFFKSVGVPFYVLVSFFVFFIIYFSLKSLHIIFVYYDWDVRYCLWVILGGLILINPLISSLSLRAPLAMSLFTLGFMHLTYTGRKRAYLLFLLSVTIHFSFLYLVVAVFASRLININRVVVVVISILFFIISSEVLPALIPLIPFEQVSQQFSNYVTNTGVGEGVGGFNALIINSVLFFTVAFFMFFSVILKNPKPNDNRLVKYKNSMNFLVVFVCLSAFQYLVFFRYSFSIILIEYAFIVIFLKNSKNIVILSLMVLTLFINLILIDIYVRKDSISLGDSVSLAFLPPAHTLLYSDIEYRKFLEVIDSEGLLK